MAVRYGKCTNFGLCAKADTRERQSVPETGEFVCQECKRPLTPIGGANGRTAGRPSPVLWVVVLIFLLLAGGGYFAWRAIHRQSPPPPPSTALLRLSGSNTIGAQLAPALAQAWLTGQGASDVGRVNSSADESKITGTLNGSPVTVEIKAHGSATAFTDLGSDACDIGMASRKIKPQEAAALQAKGLGDLTSNADERVLGLDGVAVIVNEANSVDSMSKSEVADIFSGSSSGQNWHIYARDDKSGTYDTFKDRVLGTRLLVANAKRFEDSRVLAKAVSEDSSGIGFVGLPYAVGVKKLAISEKGTSPLVPNTMTVRTESYPLSRRLYLYLPDNAKPAARDFVRFAISDAGQGIVEREGFVGQKLEFIPTNQLTSQLTSRNAPKAYLELIPSADRVSVNFYFRTGSSELDTKAMDDIKRVSAALNSQFGGRGVMLIGFADSTGTPAGNVVLSKDRAQSVSARMGQEGINPVFITGFGAALPVADNGTPEGREKNRRVELWLRK